MPYATGNANNATDLVNAITSFCAANGWTLTSGALSKGNNHFRPAVVGTHIKCEMGDAAGFASPGMTGNQFPYISLNGVFPVFYRLFLTALNGADTLVLCVQEANATEYKYLMFGNLENKVGTWTGGQWMFGTYGSQYDGSVNRQSNAGTDITITGDGTGGTMTESYSQAHGGPLFAMADAWPNFGSNWVSGTSFLQCDIDGGTYRRNTAGQVGVNSSLGCAEAMRFMRLPLKRQPNTWNGESVLVPFHVYLGRASSTASRLGTVGHVRAMRMDNYEPADIITLGQDRWMVLPTYRRDPSAPLGLKATFNSTAITGHSGQLAYAFKYDGP